MKLVGGKTYEVLVRMPSGKNMVTKLNYCGGSFVDLDGHYIGQGVWTHAWEFKMKRNGSWCKSFNNLHVLNISDPTDPRWQERERSFWYYWKKVDRILTRLGFEVGGTNEGGFDFWTKSVDGMFLVAKDLNDVALYANAKQFEDGHEDPVYLGTYNEVMNVVRGEVTAAS